MHLFSDVSILCMMEMTNQNRFILESEILLKRTAICVISSALIFYTIGVWGERLQRKLKFWHLIFFLLGLLADTVGTSLMEHIAELTHLHDEMHTVTGAIAILLMFVHALWAIWTYVKGTPIEKRHFNRFSIVVWCIWLIPYLIGVYLGMRLHV